MLGVVPVISKLNPASPKETRGSSGAIPSRKDELLRWFRHGQDVLRALEGLDPTRRQQIESLTKRDLGQVLFVQGLFQVAEYPGFWHRDLTIALGGGVTPSPSVFNRAVQLAQYLNPGWNPTTLVYEIQRYRKEVSGAGGFPALGSYSLDGWVKKLEAYRLAMATADRPDHPRPPGGEGGVGSGVTPLALDDQAKQRIERAFLFIERLAEWQPGLPFQGTVDRDVVVLGLMLRAVQEGKQGRGEWSGLAQRSGLALPTVLKHLAALFPQDAAPRRAEQLAALRASIRDRKPAGKMYQLRGDASKLMQLSGVSWLGRAKHGAVGGGRAFEALAVPTLKAVGIPAAATAVSLQETPAKPPARLSPALVDHSTAAPIRLPTVPRSQPARTDGQERAPEAEESPGYDGLRIYCEQALQEDLLTPQQERELAVRMKEGDGAAQERLVAANLRLVVKIARDYDGLLPLLDLINEGNIGLMKAVERFDPNKGAKLSTYAAWWIKQAIRRAISNQGATVRMPVHVHDGVRKLERTERDLRQELDRAPSDGELAAHLGWEVEKVEKLRKGAVRSISSLDETFGDEADTNRYATLEDPLAPDAAEDTGRSEMHELVRELISDGDERAGLSPRQKWILKQRFFVEDGDLSHAGRSLEGVGEDLGLTRERIRQIQVAALRKLRMTIELIERRGRGES